MDDKDVVHVNHRLLFRHKRKRKKAICSNVDGPRDDRTKWSRSERETNTMWYHLDVESKIWHKSTYLWNKNRLTDTETRLWLPRLVGRGGKNWEFGISRGKLLHIEWINRSYYIAQGTIFSILWQNIMEKNILLWNVYVIYVGLLRWHGGKEPTCQWRRHKSHGFTSSVRKIPWSRKLQPTPVFLSGKFHRGAWWATTHGIAQSWTQLSNWAHTEFMYKWIISLYRRN